jgi:hypothetical protein
MNAFHELRGGDIFREFTLKEAINLIKSYRSDWKYADHAAQIAIAAAANQISVYEAAQLLQYYSSEEDITDTDEDIFAVADWLLSYFGWE